MKTKKPTKSRKNTTTDQTASEALVAAVVEAMKDRKAKNILVMDLREIGAAVADFFVLCTGSSDTQIGAIADNIDKHCQETMDEHPWHKEGMQQRQWVLIDYSDVVAHVFSKEKREFYGLEALWGDANLTHIAQDD